MKKPTIILIASHEGFRIAYSAILAEDFNVITRETIPAENDIILRRARLIFVINLWNPIQEHALNDIAESNEIPTVVLEDSTNTTIKHFTQRNQFLHALYNPIRNDQIVSALKKILIEVTTSSDSEWRKREKISEETYKKAYKSSTFRRKIEKIIHLIRKDYATINNFQILADKFDLNYESMRRAIIHKTGKSPQEYLKENRLEKMLQLIQLTQLSIEEICLETGFKDVTYARKQFLEHYDLCMKDCIAQYRLKK